MQARFKQNARGIGIAFQLFEIGQRVLRKFNGLTCIVHAPRHHEGLFQTASRLPSLTQIHINGAELRQNFRL